MSASELDGYGLLSLEEVQVTLTLTFAVRGDLKVVLMCPSGTRSALAEPRSEDRYGVGVRFGVAQFKGICKKELFLCGGVRF